MKRQRLIVIGLDGFDAALAERLMAEGQMPAFAALKARAARFPLDEGAARQSGLPWEHISSGLTPEAANRWSGVDYDPSTYTAWQDGSHLDPWWAKTDLRVLVFDAPFVDIRHAKNTHGIVGWGSHSPGTSATARPTSLQQEFVLRFGEYPADEWTYGTPWSSAARARQMGEALSHAVDVRSRAAQWLAFEHFRDWDMFYLVVAELHGAVEGLWHGVDPTHPLHSHASAPAAAEALYEIHRALDRMIGQLVAAAGDATIMAFNSGGMGPNTCDIQSMVLLPELLYRTTFGKPLLTLPREWTAHADRLPMMAENETWDEVNKSWVPEPPLPASGSSAASDGATAASPLRGIARRLPAPAKALLKGARAAALALRERANSESGLGALNRQELDYIPGYRYQHYWPKMAAFAFPSFLDGRVRINLRGRERDGIVDLADYEDTLRSIEALLHECRDPRTGEPSVARIERASATNPMEVANSEGDLLVIWNGVVAALEHPRLGMIGPVPIRRTGGHTCDGVAYLLGSGIAVGDRATRSAADIVPTIVELLHANPAAAVSGKSFLDAPVVSGVPVLAEK